MSDRPRRRAPAAPAPPAWPGDLDAAVDLVWRATGQGADLKVRRFQAGSPGWPMAMVYLAGMADEKGLEEAVLAPLLAVRWPEPLPPRPDLAYIQDRVLQVAHVAMQDSPREALASLISGRAFVLLEGASSALVLATVGFERRAVGTPEIESTLRGPREAFVEDLDVNLSLLRRRLQTPALRLEQRRLGTVSVTPVVLAFVEGRCAPALVREVQHRLDGLAPEFLSGSRPLGEALVRETWSPFPLYDQTERPDRAAAALLEGRVVLVVSGTPVAMILPTTLWHLLQNAEDYYTPPAFATFARVMRVAGLLANLFMPSVYVALTTYHHEMLPTQLALTLAGGREHVPFPAVVEAFILELLFEALREAGLRLPRPAGQAISIVGALLLGESAIRANLVSPMMVIIVAVTGMASFTIPSYELALGARMVRFVVLALAGAGGVFGIMCGLVALMFHLLSLRSFGLPYLSPVAPPAPGEAGDVLIRPPAPWAQSGPLRARHGRGPTHGPGGS